MSRVLDTLQRLVSGGLMAATAAGLAAFGYGIYSFAVLRPAATAAAAAAAARAAAADGADGASAASAASSASSAAGGSAQPRAPGGAALA